MLDTYGLAKIDYLNKGAVKDWRKQIAGALVAAVGIPLTVRALPTNAGVAAAGMGASVLYDLLIAGLKRAEQPKLLEAVSAYPDAPGFPQYSGMGSYYEFSPHQVYGAPMGGFGEFYETQPVPGLEQAAAGMGATGPMLTQAAANPGQMGEYYAYGAAGIGEYYETASQGGDNSPVYDGLQPTLSEAEQALDVAEASAGLGADVPSLTQAAAGFGDMPLQQSANCGLPSCAPDPCVSLACATQASNALNIPDQPGGSRAGTFSGGDGIFG
jgi:hypothetical protein